MLLEELSDFIRTKMKMQHIYQPVMLIELLKNGGSASATDIAKAILTRKKDQINKYRSIVKKCPGEVLARHEVITPSGNDQYSLNGYGGLTNNEKKELIELCKEELEEFFERRPYRVNSIWRYHR